MRLLVTRPQPDADDLAAQLTARGHEAVVEPLMAIRFPAEPSFGLDGVQGLIATSRNGLRALAARALLESARHLPLFAVGSGTAAMAHTMGFATVIEGPAGATELAALVAVRARAEGGPLLHVAGDRLAGDLAGQLHRQGFRILQPIVYTTQKSEAFSAPVQASIRAHRLDGVLLFSPQTAAIYTDLVRRHGLGICTSSIAHFCLSEAVAERLQPIVPRRTLVAHRPNLQVMLDLVSGDR